jgi:hypothetical protein
MGAELDAELDVRSASLLAMCCMLASRLLLRPPSASLLLFALSGAPPRGLACCCACCWYPSGRCPPLCCDAYRHQRSRVHSEATRQGCGAGTLFQRSSKEEPGRHTSCWG